MQSYPDFDDDGLAALTDAFRTRSKAITKHAAGWAITRERADGESERLNIDADGAHGQLRLSIWADNVIWFRLCRGRPKNGWEFMLSFHGSIDGLDSATVVEQFIASFHFGDHLSTWRNVSPIVERSEPSA